MWKETCKRNVYMMCDLCGRGARVKCVCGLCVCVCESVCVCRFCIHEISADVYEKRLQIYMI